MTTMNIPPADSAVLGAIAHGHTEKIDQLGLLPEWLESETSRVVVRAALQLARTNQKVHIINLMATARDVPRASWPAVREIFANGYGQVNPTAAVEAAKASYLMREGDKIRAEMNRRYSTDPHKAYEFLREMGAKLDDLYKHNRVKELTPEEIYAQDVPQVVWQSLVPEVNYLLGGDADAKRAGGYRNGMTVFYVGPPGKGKAQPISSQVLTQSGWKQMGDMVVGDKVVSVDSQPSEVVGIYPQGKRPVFKVTFKDGRTVRATGDHLWEVHSSRFSDKSRVMTTDQIAQKLSIADYQNRMFVPLYDGGHAQPDIDLPMDPYILGVMLGDGSASSSLNWTKPDDFVVEEVQRRLPEGLEVRTDSTRTKHTIAATDGRYTTGARTGGRNPFLTAYQTMGLSGKRSYEKRIPEIYFSGSRQQRLDLLRGLMDTDGYIDTMSSISWGSASQGLAEDCQRLVWSLGWTTASPMRHETGNGYRKTDGIRVECRDSWEFNIRSTEPDEIFLLPRKRERVSPDHQYKDNLRLRIVSVEPDGEEECQCIRVSHPTGLYLTDNYVVTHNSSMLRFHVVDALLQSKKVVYLITENTTNKAYRGVLLALTQLTEDEINARKGSTPERDKTLTDWRKHCQQYLKMYDVTRFSTDWIEKILAWERPDILVIDYTREISGMITGKTQPKDPVGDMTYRYLDLSNHFGTAIFSAGQMSGSNAEKFLLGKFNETAPTVYNTDRPQQAVDLYIGVKRDNLLLNHTHCFRWKDRYYGVEFVPFSLPYDTQTQCLAFPV